MGDWTKLKARDGFEFDAYVARPLLTPTAALVVLHEIFGVNSHIRAVTDSYAAEGYLAIAPALFDRAKPGFEAGYLAADVAAGRDIATALDRAATLMDIEAAVQFALAFGRVGLVGYCWGGTMAYASATSVGGLSAVSGYYGGGIAAMKEATPKVPTILHFGTRDAHIPMSDVEALKAAQPSVTIHVYDADHGFNCDQRGSYNKPSADLARSRSFAFFKRHLAA